MMTVKAEKSNWFHSFIVPQLSNFLSLKQSTNSVWLGFTVLILQCCFFFSLSAGAEWQVMWSWADRWSVACRGGLLYEPNRIWILSAAPQCHTHHIVNYLTMHYVQNLSHKKMSKTSLVCEIMECKSWRAPGFPPQGNPAWPFASAVLGTLSDRKKKMHLCHTYVRTFIHYVPWHFEIFVHTLRLLSYCSS